MEFFQLIKEGGFIMAPLLVCSLIIWIVFFERLYYLRQFKRQYIHLLSRAETLIKENKIHEAKGLGHNVDPLIGAPYLVVFEGSDLSREDWEAKIARRFKETQMGLKKYLWLLGTIGSSAPFIGLFGTVVGIIKSFESIADSGKAGFAVVAAGLGEALIATAAGIIVAVIAVVFFNFFQTYLSTIQTDFKVKLEDLKELV